MNTTKTHTDYYAAAYRNWKLVRAFYVAITDGSFYTSVQTKATWNLATEAYESMIEDGIIQRTDLSDSYLIRAVSPDATTDDMLPLFNLLSQALIDHRVQYGIDLYSFYEVQAH